MRSHHAYFAGLAGPECPYTPTTKMVASPSTRQGTRAATPFPVISGPAASSSIAPDADAVTLALYAESDSIPLSPF